jgi:hypothetical protein
MMFLEECFPQNMQLFECKNKWSYIIFNDVLGGMFSPKHANV